MFDFSSEWVSKLFQICNYVLFVFLWNKIILSTNIEHRNRSSENNSYRKIFWIPVIQNRNVYNWRKIMFRLLFFAKKCKIGRKKNFGYR